MAGKSTRTQGNTSNCCRSWANLNSKGGDNEGTFLLGERAPAKIVGKGFLEVTALELVPPRWGGFGDGANRSVWQRDTGDLKCGTLCCSVRSELRVCVSYGDRTEKIYCRWS